MARRPTRRELSRLCLAALGGVLAGACSQEREEAPGTPAGELPGPSGPPDDGRLLVEPHVCRGLNTCAGLGRDGANECAGRGTCASANEHLCHAMNECSGQGGCGPTAGRNACKGQGICGVPLADKTWRETRAAFEATMRQAEREPGAAPPPADGEG